MATVGNGVARVSTVGAVVGVETGAAVGIGLKVGTGVAVVSGTAVAPSEQAEMTRATARRPAIALRDLMALLPGRRRRASSSMGLFLSEHGQAVRCQAVEVDGKGEVLGE